MKLIAAATVAVVVTAAAGAATAPAPVLAGCPLFPATSVWNKPVDNLPVAADSAAIIASIGDSGVHADFGSGLWDGAPHRHPLCRRPRQTSPKSRVTFDYADESDKGPYPIPASVPIEGGPATHSGDRHVLVVDRDSCKLYELYAPAASSGMAGRPARARSGPALERAAARRLDVGRRGRPADPAGSRALGRRRLDGPDRSRAPLHSAAFAQRASSTRLAIRRRARAMRRYRRWDCAFA